MSCQQTLYQGREPANLKPLSHFKNVPNVAQCSQMCCQDGHCITFTHKADTEECWLWPKGEGLFYLPTKSNVPPNGDPETVTGIIWKRKMRFYIPWILILVLILILGGLWWRSKKEKVTVGEVTTDTVDFSGPLPSFQ